MFKKLWSGVQEKYKKMQEEDELYYQLLGKVTLLPKFYPFTVVDKKNLTISHKQLQELCRLFYIRDPPDRNQEFIYRRNKNSATAPFQHSDACTGFSHPTDETLASNIMIPCQVT